MKKNRAYGFSLLEFLIYFLVLQFFALLMVHWASEQHMVMANNSRKNSVLLELCAAHDLLMRDLRQAPAQKSAWKNMEHTLCVWTQDDCDIGWEYDDGKLFRLHGNYNREEHRWIVRKKSLIAHDIIQCDLAFCLAPDQQTVVAVTTHIATESCAIHRVCTLRNKVGV